MDQDKPPAAGESFVCRHCGKESIAKLERIMDGWTYVGDTVVCAFCKAPVSDARDDDSPGLADSTVDESSGIDRLASLLDEAPAETLQLAPEADARFCRDCVNFLRHPFVSRCLLHDKPVEPMDDCDDFERRPDGAGESEGNS